MSNPNDAMTDDEVDEFMTLFRIYRQSDRLPEEQRKRFRELSRKYEQMQTQQDKKGES